MTTSNRLALPRFVMRINHPANRPHARAYVHEDGMEAYDFGKGHFLRDPAGGAVHYLTDYLVENIDALLKYDFVLAVLWGEIVGERPERNMDIAGIKADEKDWKADATVSVWALRNGVYAPQAAILEDSRFVFAEEEKRRRTTVDLIHHVVSPPYIEVAKIDGNRVHAVPIPEY